MMTCFLLLFLALFHVHHSQIDPSQISLKLQIFIFDNKSHFISYLTWRSAMASLPIAMGKHATAVK